MPDISHHSFSDRCVANIAYLFAKILQKCSFSTLNHIGRFLGVATFYMVSKWRKRILSNLSLATKLNLKADELKSIGIESLVSLITSVLEFPKLFTLDSIDKIAICENQQVADTFIQKGTGVVFFCAHQANWELFFLEGNSRMPGVAIGRPIKNQLLYDFILRIRTRFGGTIITPKNALKEGAKALKEGKFLGIVGDQGMPESHFRSQFLGRNAFSTTAPALLSYRTKTPLIVATMTKKNQKYHITYSEPIMPDLNKPLKEEVERMTLESLALLEESIIKNPCEWLWIHNRFKQETSENVYYRYRHDSILICVESMHLIDHTVVRKLYPKAFISYLSFNPDDRSNEAYEILSNVKLPEDYRFKFVINFTKNKQINSHFHRLSALVTLDEKKIDQLIQKRGMIPDKELHKKLFQALARNPKIN